jgi:hypothetical protein
MRRWIVALALFCSALTGLASPPAGFGKRMGFPFAGVAEAATDRMAQMSKRRDQVPPDDDDDSDDENLPPADEEQSDDENDNSNDNAGDDE